MRLCFLLSLFKRDEAILQWKYTSGCKILAGPINKIIIIIQGANPNVEGKAVQHRLDVVDAAEVSENRVGEVKSDANSAEVERYEHVPDMIDRCEGFQIFLVRALDGGSVFELSPRETTDCFHLENTWCC